MIFVNFKTYPEASGPRAVALAQICEKVVNRIGVPIIPCVQVTDLSQVVGGCQGPVWVQHIDPIEPGKTTGFVTAAAVKAHGAWGTLLNHAEHPLKFEDLKKAVALAKKNGLRTMILANNLQIAATADKLEPDYVGIEEPSLIGGKVAMAALVEGRAKVKAFVKIIKNATPLVGAGVNQKADVKASLELGTKGVLVASSIVKSLNPEKNLREMASAFTATPGVNSFGKD